MGAIPRIVMGMIIALTISKPIEIRMFKSEIDNRIATEQKIYLAKLDSLTTKSFESKIQPFKLESDSIKKAIEIERIEMISTPILSSALAINCEFVSNICPIKISSPIVIILAFMNFTISDKITLLNKK